MGSIGLLTQYKSLKCPKKESAQAAWRAKGPCNTPEITEICPAVTRPKPWTSWT